MDHRHDLLSIDDRRLLTYYTSYSTFFTCTSMRTESLTTRGFLPSSEVNRYLGGLKWLALNNVRIFKLNLKNLFSLIYEQEVLTSYLNKLLTFSRKHYFTLLAHLWALQISFYPLMFVTHSLL